MVLRIGLILSLMVLGASVRAEVAPSETSDKKVPEPAPSSEEKPKPVKGRVPREKEAEGTQAPNRFDTDTIIKSKYELNGQSLEVDTE